MWKEWIVVGLWGGIVALDTTAAFQVMISQPLVACSVTGLIVGNMPLGLMCGIFLQLIWTAEIPAGAAYTSESNIGAVAATAIAVIAFEQTLRQAPAIALALLFAVGLSFVAGKMVVLVRRINGTTYYTLIRDERLTSTKIIRAHFSGLFLLFGMGFMLTFLSTWLIGDGLVPTIIGLIPESIDIALQPIGSAFLGLGCGVLFYIFYSRKEIALLVIGLAVGTMLALQNIL
ncbi:PTS sugar transporter subunit IIC [candidate division KSB1 bacterium]|nr:PTS sugar transporter subunit IIC [candidate division KSB1 bacterium]